MQLKNMIVNYVTNYIQRYKQDNQTETTWEKPIIAFADAHNRLFFELKDSIHQNHLTPVEILESAETVIAYFIPFEKSIVKSNMPDSLSSQQWAMAYIETNQLIIDVNHALAKKLKEMGYQSALTAPTHNFDEQYLVSNWSHKHVGYIAGLGTFGLHQMLITPKGCCGRIGSLVTDAVIEPTVRPKEEYCHYKYNKSCKVCIKRCPSGALTDKFFDRHRCYDICLKNAEYHKSQGLADVCGKCMSMVPCSFGNSSST